MADEKKEYCKMKNLSQELNAFKESLLAMKENIPPSMPKEKPLPILPQHLEHFELISREVKGGQPVLNIHLLDSCGYDGCIPSSSGLHTITTLKKVPDLKPRLKQDDRGGWEPVLDENNEPVYDVIYHSYNTASLCPHCGQVNKYLMRLKASGIGADAMGKHLNNYHFESEELQEKAEAFLEGELRGGILWGNAGNGKTHLLSAVARELIFRGHRVRYVSHQHLLETIKRSFNGEEDPRIKWLDGMDYILFDELGFCPKTDWARQTTNELIHAAHAAGVKMLFASNLSPKQLKSSLLDMRTSSRMGEIVGQFVYQMKGDDWRGGFN